MKVQFHGGPADGRRMDLPNDAQAWTFPVLEEVTLELGGDMPYIRDLPSGVPSIAHYERMNKKVGDPPNLSYLYVPFVYKP